MRSLAVLAALCGVASAEPVWRPPPKQTPASELVLRLEESIRNRNAGAIASLFADPVHFAGLPFCGAKFTKAGVAETTAVRAIAKCLAQQKLIATTRKSGTANGALVTVEPGIEIEVVYRDEKIQWIGGEWQRDHDRGIPTLTTQAFEALRTAGTAQVDAQGWIKICLDKTGAITSKDVLSGTVVVDKIADWKFKPFRKTAACALLSLGTVEATEVLPESPVDLPGPPTVRFDNSDFVDQPLDFTGLELKSWPDPVKKKTQQPKVKRDKQRR
jgi:hypothetical protein